MGQLQDRLKVYMQVKRVAANLFYSRMTNVTSREEKDSCLNQTFGFMKSKEALEGNVKFQYGLGSMNTLSFLL